MSRAFTPGLHLSHDTLVKRLRELPVRGQLLKKVGDKVKSSEIIARAEMLGDLSLVRIAEKMGINPEEVKTGLKVKVGDVVKAGDLLCEHVGLFGLFRSQFPSPTDGAVEIVSELTGHIGIRQAPHTLELNAYISGEILEVQDGKSLTVGARAAYLQGIFGVGGERIGYLKELEVAANLAVEEGHIPAEAKGTILFGGKSPSAAALKAAAKSGAVGFITGSIDDRALENYLGYDLGIALTGDEDVPMTLIITEGFGSLAMSDRMREILISLNGSEASINGATQVRAGAVRPEVIVTRADGASAVTAAVRAPELGGLDVGSKVRIIRFPYFGQIAQVSELPHGPEEIATGAHTRVLRAKLANGEVITVPRANVELV